MRRNGIFDENAFVRAIARRKRNALTFNEALEHASTVGNSYQRRNQCRVGRLDNAATNTAHEVVADVNVEFISANENDHTCLMNSAVGGERDDVTRASLGRSAAAKAFSDGIDRRRRRCGEQNGEREFTAHGTAG